ncbi:MAG: COP23 domain-containing protein [Microcoleus sp. PH2017_22_RUC_O_B]|uniref:COP23 domain-containing protein n=1 Tax=unclassified Microcoleus TaxID=2642155 RepID=UPI001DCF2061|nr:MULTISPECIES: COP23 domain-containing protein [unclassified Microcoleus]MCC3528709.1 COP23 domain-containing protein [Microcoleus sp. PH2017_21_RUC_O_A]MCC3540806.1 COP23 domain-containing protein [Microcoleus sp. PH2017_22_RUC_O_B]
MKIRFLPAYLLGFLLVGMIGGCDKAPFPVAKARFFCDKDKTGIPTTFVETAKDRQPVIRWKSEIFKGSGYDPETRCEQVSPRFQQAEDNGGLRYLIPEKQNEQSVICISDKEDGACNLKLFDVTPPDTVESVLRKLQANASKPLEQSGGKPYLDITKLGK